MRKWMNHSIAILLGTFAFVSLMQASGNYLVQSGDVLEINYRYTPEFNQTLTVRPDGFASLQLAGDVKMSGKTVEEIQRTILDLVHTRLRDPEVTVTLKEFAVPHFVVIGEVGSPGKFPLHGPVTALEGIAMAGGLKDSSAKHSQVLLFRRIDGETARTIVINVKKLMASPKNEEDPFLKPGDILIVPQNRISKVERFVKLANLGVYWNPSNPF